MSPARPLPVPVKLPSHDIPNGKRPHRSEDAHLFIAYQIAFFPGRRIHGKTRHYLEKMVLNYIADRPRFFVMPTASLHSEVLRHV